MRDLAQTFKALSDETRILCLSLILAEKELCVCELESALATTQSKTSRHLRYLLHAGLLTDRREGTWVYYRVASNLNEQQLALLNLVRGLGSSKLVKSHLARLKKYRDSNSCQE
jgi:ArsR family transcriptional regulator